MFVTCQGGKNKICTQWGASKCCSIGNALTASLICSFSILLWLRAKNRFGSVKESYFRVLRRCHLYAEYCKVWDCLWWLRSRDHPAGCSGHQSRRSASSRVNIWFWPSLACSCPAQSVLNGEENWPACMATSAPDRSPRLLPGLQACTRNKGAAINKSICILMNWRSFAANPLPLAVQLS